MTTKSNSKWLHLICILEAYSEMSIMIYDSNSDDEYHYSEMFGVTEVICYVIISL